MTVDEFFAAYIILFLICVIATLIATEFALSFFLPALMLTAGFFYGLYLGAAHIIGRLRGTV